MQRHVFSLSAMENEVIKKSSTSTISPGPTICSIPSPYFLDSALASDSDINNDHHSSEEELEVINNSSKGPVRSRNTSRCGDLPINLRSASVNALPEKRKWSEINLTGLGSVGKLNRLCLTPGTGRVDQSSGSSDDEVQGFLAATMGTPVKFRTSPPVDVVKPGKSLSPPPKLFHYEVTSRKRHRHMHKPHHLQRPCLDFEKMQQVGLFNYFGMWDEPGVCMCVCVIVTERDSNSLSKV